jgi:ribosomal protein S12 methylthiotransferase
VNAGTVRIVTLGCPKNLVDAECMAALLARRGFRIAAAPEEGEIVIVNTCAFILPAKEEAVEEILLAARRKKDGLCAHVVVAGCLPQRYGAALAREFPEADLILGTAEVPRIAAHVEALLRGERGRRRTVVRAPRFLMDANLPRLLATPSHTAYLKIAEGCDNRCAYCVIPAIRGRLRSRPVEDVLREAESLVNGGVREIILAAQDTTAYGRDRGGKPLLKELLRGLASLSGLRWIRLLYTYPEGLTPEILETVAEEEKVCPYIDVPIQHIDDTILAAMGRRGGSRAIREMVARARSMVPAVALRTSLIVGFPGETARAFRSLVAFVREARFDHLGVFAYSREEGTRADGMAGHIAERTKERRRRALMEEQAAVSYETNRSLIGAELEVLIEGPSDLPGHPCVGRCARQAPEIDGVTFVRADGLQAGQFVSCRITGADTYDLFAAPLAAERMQAR